MKFQSRETPGAHEAQGAQGNLCPGHIAPSAGIRRAMSEVAGSDSESFGV